MRPLLLPLSLLALARNPPKKLLTLLPKLRKLRRKLLALRLTPLLPLPTLWLPLLTLLLMPPLALLLLLALPPTLLALPLMRLLLLPLRLSNTKLFA